MKEQDTQQENFYPKKCCEKCDLDMSKSTGRHWCTGTTCPCHQPQDPQPADRIYNQMLDCVLLSSKPLYQTTHPLIAERIKKFQAEFPQLYTGYPQGTFSVRIESYLFASMLEARDAERTRLIEGVEGMKLDITKHLTPGMNPHIQEEIAVGITNHNQALSDVLALLKKKV